MISTEREGFKKRWYRVVLQKGDRKKKRGKKIEKGEKERKEEGNEGFPGRCYRREMRRGKRGNYIEKGEKELKEGKKEGGSEGFRRKILEEEKGERVKKQKLMEKEINE